MVLSLAVNIWAYSDTYGVKNACQRDVFFNTMSMSVLAATAQNLLLLTVSVALSSHAWQSTVSSCKQTWHMSLIDMDAIS